jgi:hypothetical protein
MIPLFAQIATFWYALPLIVVVSLVYAATRDELMENILRHAGRIAVWIAGFMLVVFALLWVLTAMV